MRLSYIPGERAMRDDRYRGLADGSGRPRLADREALRPRRELWRFNHLAHCCGPTLTAPPWHQADSIHASDAADPAEDQGDSKEVQGQQAKDPRRADEALSGPRIQPS